jgi:hypothetical protein
MGPPPSKVRRSGRNEPGASILERVPILGRCSRSSPIQKICGKAPLRPPPWPPSAYCLALWDPDESGIGP